MQSFTVRFSRLIRSSIIFQPSGRIEFRLMVCLFLVLLNISFAGAAPAGLQEPAIRQTKLNDTVAARIKDSLKLELTHARINDPVMERHYLTSLLKEDQAVVSDSRHKKHGQRFYYHLAVAFTKLRLYPLAMKCYFKTLTIENHADSLKYEPIVTASLESKQFIADNIRRQDTLAIIDSMINSVMSIQSADIMLINKDSTSYNGDNEIRSLPVKTEQILNPFDDGKKAAAYALMLHVRQPVSGSRKVNVLNNVGHTFVTLIKYNIDSTIVSRSFGFYPKKNFPLAATPLFPSSPSTFKDDARHSWDEVSGTFISRRSFNKILAIVKKYDHKKYQLSHTNCTDFGLELAAEAGITITRTNGKWPLGRGNNPACTGQSMLEGRITAINDTYSGSLLLVDDLVNTKTLNHYHK